MRDADAVMLVEGISDKAALVTLATRFGRDLDSEGVSIMAMGGASALGHVLDDLPLVRGSGFRLAGLCDEAEVGDFQRGLERAGLGSNLSRSGMESLGFYVCVADLEDELIRSLGVVLVEEIIESQGELRSFRTLQKQPAWRGQARADQLRRFIGVKSGRKQRYARLLVEAIDVTRVPRPLERVLAHV